MASDLTEQDERLASAIHRQQLQQKHDMEAESVSSAHAEFKRGLEELMRDLSQTCITFASRSSGHESGISGFRDRIHHFHGEPDDTDDDSDSEQLLRRRRHRSDMEENRGESSVARRQQSRLLSRWAARQAEEMITTIERQNRESELLALAGLHAVSMLDASFLSESAVSRPERRASGQEGRVERPSTPASSLLQMWREIEAEQRAERARERRRERRFRSAAASNSTRENGNRLVYPDNHVLEERQHNTGSNTINANNTAESRVGSEDGNSDNSQEGHWTHDEHTGNSVAIQRHQDYRDWVDSQLGSDNGTRENSPDIGEGERERVRQIVRGWMGADAISSNTSNVTRDAGQRAELLGENERERVRLIREWVQETTQQQDVRGNMQVQMQSYDVQPGLVRRQARQHEGSRESLDSGREESASGNANRDAPRLRGRQAFVELLARFGSERQRELERLEEYRAVSDFAHRNRIQSLLRGRFLRTGAAIEEPRPPSTAARELGQLRQRRTVTGLREGFQNSLESVDGSHPENSSSDSGSTDGNEYDGQNFVSVNNIPNTVEETDVHSQISIQDESQAAELPLPINSEYLGRATSPNIETEREFASEELARAQSLDELNVDIPSENEDRDSSEEDTGRNLERTVIQRAVGLRQFDSRQDTGLNNPTVRQGPSNSDAGTVWQDDLRIPINRNLREMTARARLFQLGALEGRRRFRQGVGPIRQVNNAHVSDDAVAYNMELQELLGRRSVTTVLASEFRESLDQLIRSYLRRQGSNTVAWDLEGSTPRPDIMEGGQQETQMEARNQTAHPFVPLPPPPPPPPPPPRPRATLWHQDLRQAPWTRQPLPRPDIEWEAINDLRNDMGRLQQGMLNMQRMLEACVEMQLELQRSVRQEVSAALNRSNQELQPLTDGSNWETVRKGLCCVCCDTNIDTLLYRCGHMCTCLRCATELLHNSGKCPMCRAPIVEVIRAYCVM